MKKILTKGEATEYFEAQAKPEYQAALYSLNHREILKAYDGKVFVLFKKSGPGEKKRFKIISTYQVVEFWLDHRGVCAALADQDGVEFEFSHVPEPLPLSGNEVFLSTPSWVWISKEIYKEDGRFIEGDLSVAVMVKQTHKADHHSHDGCRFADWSTFKHLSNGD
jgi:hypothetical protein